MSDGFVPEDEAFNRLRNGDVRVPPLRFKVMQEPRGRSEGPDALLDVSWEDLSVRFAVEYKSRSTPKEFRGACYQALRAADLLGLQPLVMMPYMAEAYFEDLQRLKVSGLDLNGNAFLMVPAKLLVIRSGLPNQYRDSRPIKSPYRGTASLVARTLLLYRSFASVSDVYAAARDKGADSLAMSTVSKALQRLEEDLLIDRVERKIFLLGPDELLEKLVDDYREPRVRRRVKSKCPPDMINHAFNQAPYSNIKLVPTGLWSTQAYAVGARGGVFTVYCSDIERLAAVIGPKFEETEFFPDWELLEVMDDSVYFDRRVMNGYTWASPIQAYVELMQGDKRDREMAEQVRKAIALEGPWNTP